jgi:integrase
LTNRRRQRSRVFRGTKRAAERELRRLIAGAERGQVTGTDTRVADLMARWLDLADDDLSPTTLREYRRLVAKRIGPAIGDTPLTKLTTGRLDDLYQALARDEGLSPASVRQIHSIIRRCLRQGVRWGWIEHNVAVNASPPRVHRSPIEPPTIPTIQTLLAEADARDPSFGVLVRLAIATGMRRGELCGLQWCDVDMDRRRIEVRRAVVAIPNGTAVKLTKTGGTRRLSLDAASADLLGQHETAMAQRAAECGTELAAEAYLFSHEPDGSRPWHPDNVTAAFRRLPSNGGKVRLHDLRHALATQLLAAGVDVNTVSGRLGHTNTSTTLNIYAHVLEESDEAAANIIGELFA